MNQRRLPPGGTRRTFPDHEHLQHVKLILQVKGNNTITQEVMLCMGRVTHNKQIRYKFGLASKTVNERVSPSGDRIVRERCSTKLKQGLNRA